MIRALVVASVLALGGCAPEAAPTTTASPTKVEPAGVEPAKGEPAKVEPAKVEPAKVEPPRLGRDPHSVVPCTTAADCGWDDNCMPSRCVEAGIVASACDESAPPPGECRCIEGGCTLEPKTTPVPSGTCEIRGCEVDRAAGRCIADTGGVPENIRSRPGVNEGPSCDCPNPAKGCVFTWIPAVPCTTDRDCWVDPSPRRHPIARPKALRKRDFKPCADGEVAPKCGPANQCILGPAYSC